MCFANLAYFALCCNLDLSSAPWPILAKKQHTAITKSLKVLFLTICVPKFTKCWETVGDHCTGPNTIPQLSTACTVMKMFANKSRSRWKTSKSGLFDPNFFRQTIPTFLCHFVSATYPLPLPFGKVWFEFLCWPQCAKPGNEAECRIDRRWIKMKVLFFGICRLTFMKFWDSVGESLWFLTMFTDCLYHVSFRRYWLLNLPLSCKLDEKHQK